MKFIFFLTICISVLNTSAQIKYSNDSVLVVKPQLKLGDEIFYEINEITKIKNEFFIGSFTKTKSLVSIKLVDTLKGYWLVYRVRNVESTNKKFASPSILDSLTNGIKIYFIMNEKGWQTDSNTYFTTKNKLVQDIDSIIKNRKLSLSDSLALSNSKMELLKEEGLENYIKPLIAFNNIYYRTTFKKERKFYYSCETNIIGKQGVRGLLEQKIGNLNVDKNQVKLFIKFTPNRVEAAEEFAPTLKASLKVIDKNAYVFMPEEMKRIRTSTYTLNLQSCVPTEVSIKNFSRYIVRIKNDFEMNLIE